MTIATIVNRMDLVGDGTAGPFPYTFMIYDKIHIKVYVDGVGPKIVDTHYTVSGVGIGLGNVTFTAGNFPALNAEIIIIRDVPLTQLVDYINHSAFDMDILEKSLDYLTIIAQQFNELVGRVVKLPITSLVTNLTLPDSVAGGEVIKWNAGGTALDLGTIGLATALNVITNQGDIIYGGAGGVPDRLGAGTSGQYLKTKGLLANPEWDDISSDFNPTNLIRNGSVEVWSGGAALAPDYWTLTGAAATVAREAAIIKHGLYSAKVTRAGTDCHLSRNCYVDMGSTYIQSRTFTFGAWVYASVASRVRLRVYDGVTTYYSSYHTGGSTWEFLTVTVTAGAAVVAFTVGLAVDTGNTSGYIDGATLIEGSVVIPFGQNPREWTYDKVVQVVNVQTGEVATGVTALPYDDTIPQIAEGTEFMTLAITPKSIYNKLKIEVVANFSHSVARNSMGMALFQDATANALAASRWEAKPNASDGDPPTCLTHYMVAGTIAATTFRVRAGGDTGATITFNGVGAARKFGGVLASSITITEYTP